MSTFRVTQTSMVDRSLSSLQLGLGRLSDLQEQLSSGRRLNRPSDSPTDTATAMRLRSSLSAAEQYGRNAADGIGRLGLVDQTLFGVTDLVGRAQEIAVQGANSGAMSPASREALATEVDQIRAAMLDDANATYLSRPVFGGITAGDAAFDDTGSFVGVDGEITRRVSDNAKVRVDVDGKAVFGDGATSVFAELDALATALRAGDDAGVQSSIGALAARQETVSTVHAEVGAAYKRIEGAQGALEDKKLDLTTSLTDVENIDLPRTMIDINLQEVAYQTALSSAARVLQPSLIEFLR
jgi:flagellar hook-associated protein 3 FlgL